MSNTIKKLNYRKRNYCLIQFAIFSLFIGVLASFSIVPVFADTNTSTTSATPTTSTINVNLSDGITIRVLDSTATSDLEDLVFDFIPTDEGTSTTKNAVVEVGTSNETGYTLYMQSDWRIDNTSSTGRYKDATSEAEFTTDLIHNSVTSTPAIEDSIPTRLPSAISSGGALANVLSSDYPFWYYYNTKDEESKVIPAYGNPDTLAEAKEAVEADRTTVPITVGVDTSIVSGTYRNKLVFTAVGNQLPVDYIVHFDANTSDAVSGMPEDLEDRVIATSKKFIIPEANATKSRSVFLGWSEDPNAVTADYVAGDTITVTATNQKLSADQAAEKTLYAVWRDDFWNITYMQEMLPEVCAAVTTPVNTATTADTTGEYAGNTAYVAQRSLYDIRDGKQYYVRKLADGNCWMVQNLDLDLSTEKALSSDTTDLNTKSSYTPSYTTITANGAQWTSYEIAYSYDIGDLCRNDNLDANEQNVATYSCTMPDTASIGNYYVPFAAWTEERNTDNSICAKNWQLPGSTGSAKSYSALLGAYGIASGQYYAHRIRGFPLNFVLAGGYWVNDARAYPSYFTWSWYYPSLYQDRQVLSVLAIHSPTGSSTIYTDLRENQDQYRQGASIRCVAR